MADDATRRLDVAGADLLTLAGQSVRFRFRMGEDQVGGTNYGWFIDDVRLYTCSPEPVNPSVEVTLAADEPMTSSSRTAPSDSRHVTPVQVQQFVLFDCHVENTPALSTNCPLKLSSTALSFAEQSHAWQPEMAAHINRMAATPAELHLPHPLLPSTVIFPALVTFCSAL